MACFDSCGRNPKLVKSLVNKLPIGHTHIQDRCELRSLCPVSYRCDDTARTTVRSYGNCAQQIYIDEIEVRGGVTGKVTCYLDSSASPCYGDIRRPEPVDRESMSDRVTHENEKVSSTPIEILGGDCLHSRRLEQMNV